MKFPGRRKSKHYFPVNESTRIGFNPINQGPSAYIVGIDQLLVDIEVKVTDEFLHFYDIPKGQSMVFDDKKIEVIYEAMKQEGDLVGEFAGGAIGNTLHNFSILSDCPSVALGAICENIKVGDYAFKYLSNTTFKTDFSHLKPCKGAMGRAFCFITPDGERTFVIGKGIMNELCEDYIPESVVAGASALLVSSFLLRDPDAPIYRATHKAVSIAKENDVPVVMALGTSAIIKEKKDFIAAFIKENVNVLACNLEEISELVGHDDPLLAAQEVLDSTDLILLTVGARGLYLCGHVEREHARETKDLIHSKSIGEYNKYEYSRAMLKKDCRDPMKIYSHINPYMGGPLTIKNTNGAGDAALSALLHDMAANVHHRELVPNSPKHSEYYLTYSSLHQISKYSNRVSFEVLNQNSPRLGRGLPEKEECLEESYWAT